MRIFYDVTRLLDRVNAPTPTGIDRVDIKYAFFILNNDKYEANFVFLKNNIFYLCESNFIKKILHSLNARWILGVKDGEKLPGINDVTLKYTVKNKSTDKLGDPRFVDSGLFHKLVSSVNKPGVYLNFSHHGVGQVDSYYIFKTLGGLKIGFYLHDIIPIDYPEYVKEGDELTHQKRVLAMVDFGDVIFVNSEYTKERLLDNCIFMKREAPSIYVLQIGVEKSFLNLLPEDFPEELGYLKLNDYFIYVGTIEPRKNHLMLLNLWRSYFNKTSSPKLVLLGKRGWNNQAVFDILDRSKNIKNNVVELSGVSDGLMISLILGSKGVVFPTFVEGWGMPLVEALSLHVPVLAADIPSLREAGQGKALYIDPLDAIGWKKQLLRLLEDKEFAREVVSEQNGFSPPQWESAFEEFDRVLFYDLNFENKINKVELRRRLDNFQKSSFFKKASSNVVSSTETSILDRKIMKVIDGVNNEKRKKLKKFFRDPKQFFQDSRKPLFKKIAFYLDRL